MACNFATFEYMIDRAGGDLAAAANAITELSEIYCAGVLQSGGFRVGDEMLDVRREIQGDVLPPVAELPPVSALARELLGELSSWPADVRAPPARTTRHRSRTRRLGISVVLSV